MNVDYPLLSSAAFIVISLCAAIFRTHIVLIASSVNMSLCAIVLLLSMLSANDDRSSDSMGIVLIGLSTLAIMIFCGVAIFVYRSRGTVRIDDFRDLRG